MVTKKTTKRTTKNGNKIHTSYTGKRSGHWVTKAERLARYLRDDFTCGYCGLKMNGKAWKELTLDHLQARVTGGSDEATNTVTACRRCNSARQDRAWASYATGGAIDRIEQNRNTDMTNFRALAKALLAGTAFDAAIESLR